VVGVGDFGGSGIRRWITLAAALFCVVNGSGLLSFLRFFLLLGGLLRRTRWLVSIQSRLGDRSALSSAMRETR